MSLNKITSGQQIQALTASTLAFTICFAVWTIFSIIGIKIKNELGLNDTEFGILVATPILTGSLSRIFLGVWADQYGGRLVLTLQMLATGVATFLLTFASTYPTLLLAALGVGLAGGSFAVGVQYVSTWFPKEKKGTALGIFGAGNVGSAVTTFGAPILLVAMGGEWQDVARIYAIVVAVAGVLFFLFTKNDPALQDRKAQGVEHVPFLKQLEPLKNIQVWRFSLYYFFVFGAFVALALWLPRYYVGAYRLDLATAGMLTAAYAMPGSVFRALGGWMSDKWGARAVMYWTFIACVICTFVMSYPQTKYEVNAIGNSVIIKNIEVIDGVPLIETSEVIKALTSVGKENDVNTLPSTETISATEYAASTQSVEGLLAVYDKKKNSLEVIAEKKLNFSFGIPLWLFVSLTVVLGFFMSLGKAAVYKHIPVYYPNHVGSVGGMVGLIGGLGGFFLPITFGFMNDMIGVWTSCFMLLTVIIAIALTWMHFAIQRMERKQHPELRGPKYLPELATDEESIMAFLESEALRQRSELLAQESQQMEQRAAMLKEQSEEMLAKSKDLAKA